MGREITSDHSFSEKLVKLIPAEIIGAYTAIAGIVPSGQMKTVLTGTVIILLALVPAYLWKVSNVRNISQIIISCIAFLVWAYSLGGPFTAWGIYQGYLGSIILILFTLIVPIFVKPTDPATVPVSA